MTTYPTVELALADLKDAALFEQICSRLLLDDYPALAPIGGSHDLGRDAVVREWLLGDETLLAQYSLETPWHRKVRRELRRYDSDTSLPRNMIFVTRDRPQAATIKTITAETAAKGVSLQVFGRQWLILRLKARVVMSPSPISASPHVSPVAF